MMMRSIRTVHEEVEGQCVCQLMPYRRERVSYMVLKVMVRVA